MQVQGVHTIDLSLATVWSHILDRSILEEVTPGVTELVKLDENSYEARSEIELGPLKGSFSGSLLVHDIKEQVSFVLTLAQNSGMGSANADIRIQLQADSDQTKVEYRGDARLTGVLGRIGQRVLGGVVNSLATQFFNDFEQKVKSII